MFRREATPEDDQGLGMISNLKRSIANAPVASFTRNSIGGTPGDLQGRARVSLPDWLAISATFSVSHLPVESGKRQRTLVLIWKRLL